MASILDGLDSRRLGSTDWSLRTIFGPSEEPLPLEEVKAHLRVDFSDEDAMIAGYISAARELVEEETDRALVTQTLELGLGGFPNSDRIRIPRGQLQSIDSFKYTDSNGTDHTMVAGTDYIPNQYAEPAEVVLPFSQLWPTVVLNTASPVRVRFTCGYGTADDVPVRAKQAILMLVGDWYVNREDVVIGRTSTVAAKLPNGFDRLITNLRLRNYTPFGR